ncbi:SRPBCC family protein [Ancylobacter terrae]|uniref:SRPBCC family protein n=1 Tax=Ancylobacter sp. sgz301288 TaxID=3342077 RepID=UPI00385AE8A2
MDDYATVQSPGTLRLERTLPGPIDRVWAYLTDPEKRALWLAAGPMELKVGGKVELVFRNGQLCAGHDPVPERLRQFDGEMRLNGTVTACDPPKRLAFTWGDAGKPHSEVTFDLASKGTAVLLTITHERLAERSGMLLVASGWHAHLGLLEDWLNGRDGRPFWANIDRLHGEYDARLPPEAAPAP